MKLTKNLNIICLIFVLFALLQVEFNAVDTTDPVYKVNEVVEKNELSFGVIHTKYAAESKVTLSEYLSSAANAAGLGGGGRLELNKYYTQQVNVLEIPSLENLSVVPWGVISNGTWNLQTVKTMASDYEQNHPGYKVIGAINGDFFDINATKDYPYTPSGNMAANNENYKVDVGGGWGTLGIDNSSAIKTLYPTFSANEAVSSLPFLTIYDENGEVVKENIQINKVNEEASDNEISLYRPVYSKKTVISITAANVYVVSSADKTVAASQNSFYGKGVISSFSDSFEIGKNQFAIQSKNEEINNLLEVGATIRVQYEFSGDLANSDAMIGFHSQFVKDGEGVYTKDGYGMDRLPRSIIGQKEDGSLVMIVVDGRQPSEGYYGSTLEEMIAISQYYGCEDAYQFDGGGSATMVILKDGEFQCVNSPSDGRERQDSDCLLLVAKVPTIDLDVTNITSSSVTVNIDVIETLDGYEDLYIEINNKKYPVAKEVEVDSLEKYTEYVIYVLVKVDDEYQRLPYELKTVTAKALPQINNVTITSTYNETTKEARYIITIDYSDPDNAVVNEVLYIKGKPVYGSGGVFSYSFYNGSMLFDTSFIRVRYNLNDDKGQKDMDITDAEVIIASPSVLIEEMKLIMTSSIENMYNN